MAWLLNLRARGPALHPACRCLRLPFEGGLHAVFGRRPLSEADAAALAGKRRCDPPYDDFLPCLRGYEKEETVLVEEAATNYGLVAAIEENPHLTALPGADPITARKGVKNETELANIRECHIRDGVALVRFEMDLERALAEGRTLYETDIEKMLQNRRRERPAILTTASDDCGLGPNAAMMHYHAEGETNSKIEPHGFLLVDNGGQYDCGTTDITRTYRSAR